MGFFNRHREPSLAVSEYEQLLGRLVESADDPDDNLPDVASAASRAGLHGRALQRLNENAFRQYVTRALHDNVLTIRQYLALDAVKNALGVATPPDVDRAALIAAVNGGLLREVEDPLVLAQPGESVYLEWAALLMKEVVHREFRGGYGGVSVRVAPGVRISSGRARGHSVVTGTSLEAADQGTLSITSTRTAFLGSRKTFEFPHKKLINFTVFADGIQFHVSGRQAAPLFSGFDGEIFAAHLNQAVQRTLARDAVGENDAAVLAAMGDEMDMRVQASVGGGPPFELEPFVMEQSRRTGRPPEVIRTYLGDLANQRAAELEAQLPADYE